MEKIISFLFFIYFHTVLISAPFPDQDAILNGFKQFLGTIHTYESKQLTAGLSKNALYLYGVNDHKYVVRILGDSWLKRCNEIDTHRWAADRGLSPKIYYYDNDRLFVLMDFIEGNTLVLEQAKIPLVLDCVAEKIRLISQHKSDNIFVKKDIWHELIENYKKIQNRLNQNLKSLLEQAFHTAEIIYNELESEQRPLVFCHNDLNYRNIFFTGKDILFIDWEMAGMNYEFYDHAFYSVFVCLDPASDYYLLTKYLQYTPSHADVRYFQNLKLLIRIWDVFYLLAFLPYIPKDTPMDSIKDIQYYMDLFARDVTVVSDEFLYEIAISQLQEFFKEYKDVRNLK